MLSHQLKPEIIAIDHVFGGSEVPRRCRNVLTFVCKSDQTPKRQQPTLILLKILPKIVFKTLTSGICPTFSGDYWDLSLIVKPY